MSSATSVWASMPWPRGRRSGADARAPGAMRKTGSWVGTSSLKAPWILSGNSNLSCAAAAPVQPPPPGRSRPRYYGPGREHQEPHRPRQEDTLAELPLFSLHGVSPVRAGDVDAGMGSAAASTAGAGSLVVYHCTGLRSSAKMASNTGTSSNSMKVATLSPPICA
jgi:hypothetical protein